MSKLLPFYIQLNFFFSSSFQQKLFQIEPLMVSSFDEL